MTSKLGLGNNTTSDLSEGSRLYYTDSRALSAVSTGASKKILYVAQDTGNDSYDGSIGKPYKTIQAAINAANSIAAYYAPVVIMIAPPTGNGYVENLSLTQQGIVLQSAAGTYRNNILIRGNVTINLTGTSGGANFIAASNEVYFHGLTFFNGGSGNTITFSGSTFQRLWIDDCYIDCTGAGNSALLMTNTGVNGVKSTITSRNTDWNNSAAAAATCIVSAGRLFLDGPNPAVQNANASGQSLLVDGASAAGPTVTLDKTTLSGQVSVSDNTAAVYLTFCSISSGSAAAIVTPSSPNTGFIFLGSVALTTTATNSITGSGIVSMSGVAKTSTGGDVISTVTQSLIAGFPQGATMIGAGSTQNTNTLLTVKNGHITSQQTTAPTSALQAAAGSTATRTLTRCTDTAGNISITPNGSGIASGNQLIVTFNKSHATAPVVVLSPANAAAAQGTLGIGAYVTSTTTTFTIAFANAGTAATAYNFTYQVIET